MAKIFILICLLILSCTNKSNSVNKQSKKNEISGILGNKNLIEIYSDSEKYVIEDSLRSIENTLKIKKAELMNYKLVEDYYEDEKIVLKREKYILNDSSEIEIIIPNLNWQKATYKMNHKTIKTVKRYYGNMLSKNAEIEFYPSSLEIYKLNKYIYILVGQPERWCGLANQFDLYQEINLERNQIRQFTYYDGLYAQIKRKKFSTK
jgi:hypothetical protein